MSFVFGIAVGAVCALIVAWYVRHPDERDTEEEAKESSVNDRDKAERERLVKEQQRQYDMLMRYTGAKQK